MKIERSKPKKGISDLPRATKDLLQQIQNCNDEELIATLKSISVWRYGKCELYHWIDVLDRFDSILGDVTCSNTNGSDCCIYMCPKLEEPKYKEQAVVLLNFTALLIEHSYARHIYNSTEHLCVLLACPDLEVVLAVLNLLYVFSKRSNFISRLPAKQRNALHSNLEYLGETWGGKQNGFGLADCCKNHGLESFPPTCTTVYFEYQLEVPVENQQIRSVKPGSGSESIVLEQVDKIPQSVPELVKDLTSKHKIPLTKQMQLLSRIRLAKCFSCYEQRLKCILARLHAISILVYSVAPSEVVDPLIYGGFVEELVEILEVKEQLMEIKAAVLRTLTAIIHFEKDPRLGVIIEATGAATYHGFLPSLVRECVASLACKDAVKEDEFPLCFATALFSFLYHLATYEASGEALVSSGIMESLLQVLDWKVSEPSNITLVTRAVRVIDLITNLDMTSFHSLGGWDKMVRRLEVEVARCREEAPGTLSEEVKSATPRVPQPGEEPVVAMEMEEEVVEVGPMATEYDEYSGEEGQCMPERAALIKSVLNFLKKAIPDPAFAENIRSFVDSSLPRSLKHVVSNAEYYGPSIYLPATEVVTVFIFHEPSQLSSLQDNGLPAVVLNSLINKPIPVTREVLASLPNVLGAMCLNARGLQIFLDAKPFDHLFGVLISPQYLSAMRRKKGTDQMGDTASNLGVAMDELMRHQPSLRNVVISALIRLLKKLSEMGSSVQEGQEAEFKATKVRAAATEEDFNSESEAEEDAEGSPLGKGEESQSVGQRSGKTVQPLSEYILNVVHFLDAILSHNSTDDHIKEFISQGGLKPLLDLLSLPSLPIDFSTSSACGAITGACRAMLSIGHPVELLEEGLTQLARFLDDLTPFLESPEKAATSVLMEETEPLSTSSVTLKSFRATPILQRLSAVNAFIQLFINLCRASQGIYNVDARVMCVNQWASARGLPVLKQLSRLYRALVWEGFILHAAASDEGGCITKGGAIDPTTPAYIEVSENQESMSSSSRSLLVTLGNVGRGLLPTYHEPAASSSASSKPSEAAVAGLVTSSTLRPLLLSLTSRVGRSLAELMSLLVRMGTGTLHRPQRRGVGANVPPYHPPTPEAIAICQEATDLLVESLRWKVPLPQSMKTPALSPTRLWLFTGMTFRMYAVDFCELLLFDEHKQAYHLVHHTFERKGALEVFIDTFHEVMALISSSDDLSHIYGSCVEFLEVWLSLAEKLVNASAMLESSHSLPVPPPLQPGGKKPLFNPLFNPLAFVIKCQKELLPCLQALWDSEELTRLTPKVVELLLSTIRHLYSSEKVIEVKLEELNASKGGASGGGGGASTVAPTPAAPRAAPGHLQQLCDMGFARELAEEALVATGNDLSSAMEWMLSHQPSASGSSGREADLTDEQQLEYALALSLENAELKPLDKTVLDDFSNALLPGSLKLVSYVASGVYRVCDLVAALSKRNGPAWRDASLKRIKDQVLEMVKMVTEKLEAGTYEMPDPSVADCVACQLHLLALLMEEMPLACAQVVCTYGLLTSCLQLLQLVQPKCIALTHLTPRWLAPLLLLLDLWEKTVAQAKFHQQSKKNVTVVWQWFESIHGRWCTYSNEITQMIEKAYQNGEQTVRITTGPGRQRYIVQFSTMAQMNPDSSTVRPVMRLEFPKKEKDAGPTEEEHAPEIQLCLFNGNPAKTAIKCCTLLMSAPLDPDTLHANLRLCLRLTRQPELAAIFGSEGGPQALLSLTQKSSFKGFTSLVALLFRHCLEQGPMLTQAMESVIRSVMHNSPTSSKEARPQGLGSKELYYVLRRLGPCACRDQALFMDCVCESVRLCGTMPKPEAYQPNSRIPQILLKVAGPPRNSPLPLNAMQKGLLNLLVDFLCADSFEDTAGKGEAAGDVKGDEDMAEKVARPLFMLRPGMQGGGAVGQIGRTRQGSYRRQARGNVDNEDMASEDMNVDAEVIPEGGQDYQSEASMSGSVPAPGSEKMPDKKPLFSKAAVLRLLAELVDSYPSCAKMVTESSREIKIDGQPAKEMPVLAFIFDHLLPASFTHSSSVPTIAKLAKTFLHCLATSNYTPEAISAFVTEFKAAFSRATNLPESQLKHSRIRALTGLLSQVLDNQNGFSNRAIVNPSQFARLLIRKGFISDLARAVHNINLSSPSLSSTVNSILKPLEVLTRIVNQVASTQKKSKGGEKGRIIGIFPSGGTTSTTTSTSSQLHPPASEASNVLREPGITPSLLPSGAPNTVVSTSAAAGVGGGTSAGQAVPPGSRTAPHERADESNILEATHESLIPLEEEDDDEALEGDVEAIDRELMHEARSLAREMGRHGALAEDIQDIVDELLEREPGGPVMGSGGLIRIHSPGDESDDTEGDGDEESITESDIVDMEEDNFNSAGEELDEDEGDESRAAAAAQEHGEDEVGSDLSSSETDTDEEDEEHDEEQEGEEEEEGDGEEEFGEGVEDEEGEGMTGEPDEQSNNRGNVAEEEEMMLDDHDEDEESVVGVEAGDGYDLEGEEEEEEGDDDMDEGEEELDLEYGEDEDEFNEQVYLHPHAWRDMDLDITLHGFSLPSFLPRVSHVRVPQQGSEDHHSSLVHTMPTSHPLLTRRSDVSQQSNVRVVSGASGVHFEFSAEHHGDNMVAMQQLLNSIGFHGVGGGSAGGEGGGASASRPRASQQVSQSTRPVDEASESTSIPSALSRWEEESAALDGAVAPLCISTIRAKVAERLEALYKEEVRTKPPQASTSAKLSETTTPHMSQATFERIGLPPPTREEPLLGLGPSSQSSAGPATNLATISTPGAERLSAMATSMSPTIDDMRNMRDHLLGRRTLPSTFSQEALSLYAQIFGGVPPHRTNIADAPPPAPPVPVPVTRREVPSLIPVFPLPVSSESGSGDTTSTVATDPSLANFLTTFDGSQESARAALVTTNPDDPLYTFLSAIAGAPAPSLTGEASPFSPPPPPPPPAASQPEQQPSALGSPRLPVFTQFQPNSDELPTSTATSSIPVSVIRDSRGTLQPSVEDLMSDVEASAQYEEQVVPQETGTLPPSLMFVPDLARAMSGIMASSLPSSNQVAASSVPHTVSQSPSPSETLASLLRNSLQVQPFPPPIASTATAAAASNSWLATLAPSQGLPNHAETQTTVQGASLVTSAMSTMAGQSGPSSSSSATQAGATASSRPSDGAEVTLVMEPIDPAFLEALPDGIRQEVIAQHARDQRQRLRRAQREGFASSISAEFLSALPQSIQEEVLQQERLERTRQAAPTAETAGQPVDNAGFLHNLPPDLRRSILADMDDTDLSHLPSEIAAEARTLRQEQDTRHRHILEERHAMLERMIDSARMGEADVIMHPVPMLHGLTHGMDPSAYSIVIGQHHHPHILDGRRLLNRGLFSPPKSELSSKQMLDQEALTCLLVLLFLDQNKLHVNRLHRIMKNLSQHQPTRAWILASLLAILQATKGSFFPSHTCPMPQLTPLTPAKGERGGAVHIVGSTSTPMVVPHPVCQGPHWLNMSINAALGSNARVFQFETSSGKGSGTKIHIHPHAGIAVCNSVLDLLVFLARQFPSSFIASDLLPPQEDIKGSQPPHDKEEPGHDIVSNVWQILMRLDGVAVRKGKGTLKTFQYSDQTSSRSEREMFSSSILGQLMLMLQHDIIKESVSLTDKVLRLLALICSAIPKTGLSKNQQRTQPTAEAVAGAANGSRTLAATTSVTTTTTSAAAIAPTAPHKPLSPRVQSAPLVLEQDVFAATESREDSVVDPSLLRLVVYVMTSGHCGEEGLEDATQLLTHLSKCSEATRKVILDMLLDGIRTISCHLCSQVLDLQGDLLSNMEVLKARRKSSVVDDQYSRQQRMSGSAGLSMQGAGGGAVPGVVLPSMAPSGHAVDHSNDLHLPSMVPLTCKGSQQSSFIRMLKVVLQLCDSIQSSWPSAHAAREHGQGGSSDVTGSADQQPNGQEGGRGQQPGPSSSSGVPPAEKTKGGALTQPLSEKLELDDLWTALSSCLDALADTQDSHAVLVLQPTVEAFFLVHGDRSSEPKQAKKKHSRLRPGRLSSFHTISDTESNPASPAPHIDLSPAPNTPLPIDGEPSDPYAHLSADTAKFLQFADRHRTVLNQILRQSSVPLPDGPFAVLVSHTRLLDFDIKRKYFRQELEQFDDGIRRDDLVLHLRRDHVFEDSFRELYRRTSEELKANFYIQFQGEEGQDAGGLLREWYLIIAREMFNPNYALFKTTAGDRATYMPNPSSHVNPIHLDYFKFVGRIIAKAIYDNKLLDCYFTRSFYKHILGKPVHYTDMEAEDYTFYQGMVYLLEHDLNEFGADLTFSIEIEEFGKTESKDLKPGGHSIPVTEANKREYVQLACQMKMTGSIRPQIKSFLEGFYEVIPKELISIFNEQELELLISGLPTIDIDDLKANTEYHKYTEGSLQIQWFWRALRTFDQADRARFLQFVTGTSKVPLQGFAALEGMNGTQKFQIHRDDRSKERLPTAHTCFNQLDLPPYETYDKLRSRLLTAVRECPEGFGFA